MSSEEKAEFVDMVAQAVIDRIEERERVNYLAEMVVNRILAIQKEEATIESDGNAKDKNDG